MIVPMDKEEAASVLAEVLQNYRTNSYEALRDLVGSHDVYEIANPFDPPYQVEYRSSGMTNLRATCVSWEPLMTAAGEPLLP